MAKKSTKNATPRTARPLRQRIRRGVLLCVAALFGAVLLSTFAYRFIGPPTTPYQIAESWRLNGLDRNWVPMDRIAPVMARSVVAAEDANFCLHWGLDVTAIRAAMESGANRGGSTISQQVVKNVYLWQGRSWVRKSIEAIWTPLSEAIWPKRRVLELYLNVVEFDEGVFGVDAAAGHYFGVSAADLTPVQAARLAMVLPDPKGRDAANPTAAQRNRTAAIMDGAATILADGRASCFED
ncbi:monofunctional biosynthetic peptidoglycan transglycosylase [Loktanella sp. SALINAS62]|uniref:monofunctional biosynthetic peptidoglycan transglycosylase n=1 Tax=Loktanella sp. SALINAS62 TaxID=2706124 RepID=UPI001B8C6B12|nr:monofunctional biosynthetic peptidoglycan transglycosylase [Loktanella sp. SALINAS62]MBS1301804.1 monofunctional biosynthetic peptidoglycan transglycosylase [Loktanella sp. SALINAS62]